MVKILFIDTDNHINSSLKSILAHTYSVTACSFSSTSSGSRPADIANAERADIVVLDVSHTGSQGFRYLKELGALPGSPPVIIISRTADIRQAVQAMRLGAYDFLHGPLKIEQLTGTIRKAVEFKARRSGDGSGATRKLLDAIIGESLFCTEVKKLVQAYAGADSPVLLTGESGTGKDLAARTIHCLSSRREGPFIPINCGAIPETLIESELFGSVKGAYTDARDRMGCFERASGGTLFLDEIGEMKLPAQVKLLRVLEEKSVTRIGGTRQIPINVRIVSATNHDLKRGVNEGNFRRDLYYRISILLLNIPPLRKRSDDIPLLSAHFLETSPGKNKYLSSEAREKLKNYSWPGNVRELKNVLERAVVLSSGAQIGEKNILFQ